MKKLLILLVLSIIYPVFAAETVELYVGQQKTLNVSGAEQISIAGEGKIARGSILKDGKQVLITGHAPGTVSMTINYADGRKEEYTVRVLPREREQVISEFDKIAPLFNDIKIIPLGDNIGLSGNIYSAAECSNLQAFLDRYPQTINLMQDKRGDVLLQMDAQIIEVNLTGAANLGIDWFAQSANKVAFPQGLDYGEIKTPQGSIQVGEEYVPRRILPDPQYAIGPIARLSPFTFKLNFLVDKGQARVLARPKLVCKSGEKAEFLVGGEFPVHIATQEKVQIEWKPYGTRLIVEPVLVKMGANEVDAKIRVEISDIDWANQVAGLSA